VIDVDGIETSALGDRSYLASDGAVAVVVDPQRDIDRVLALAGVQAPVTLVGETPADVIDARRELVRIGIDRIAAAATGRPEELATGPDQLVSTPAATFADLAAARAGKGGDLPAADVVLDVRLPDEWNAGHLAGATHIPLPELPARLGDVPAGTVWVHCASGYRAAVAASLLTRAGRSAVVIDDRFDQAEDAGLAVPGSA
jgi:rhodanese-related sulfurtransferase